MTDVSHNSMQSTRQPVAEPSPRSFGLVFAAFFTVIGLLPLLHRSSPRAWALGLALVLAVVAWVFPRALALPSRGWAWIGHQMHRVMSPVALGLIYFSAVVPTGLVMRAMGKDPLRLRRDPQARSYWIDRSPPGPAGDSLRNQF